MKTEATPKPILLKDYKQPDYWMPNVEMVFELGEETTLVETRIAVERNRERATKPGAPLVLNGENLKLVRIAIDGRALSESEYSVDKEHLTILAPPESFTLQIETEIEPQKNLSCAGLYKSGGMFCTQCEAESFRNITYFMDRPDVMSVYTVTVRADKSKYPVLLSNGNSISNRDLPNGRHEAVWHDPFRKPCYLFALVAGDLGWIEDEFITRSGRKVDLRIYARHGLQDRCKFAMDSLKWSMKWDEDVYGLEYDLDVFNIVVAEDFNMGAMENKGLNVFNASYILANPETATDTDYENIMAVVGHEYFHNWTGNRVTCRDWFQLSLKEGLTVFRDQRFSADMTSEAVQRIEEAIRVRTHQFAEDAGPMAHPIRPQSYISINNFYTLTVYEKGAEVIRMIETIVGRDGFRKGMDLYFKRHDGQAVTTEDFVAAMADANEIDLTQFKNWYDQAGTPVIRVHTEHNAAKELFTVTIEQSCPPSPGQNDKKPYHIPVAVGLLDKSGKDVDLQLQHGSRVSSGTGKNTMVLHVRDPKHTFAFTGVSEKPVLSLLRGFSAPVRVEFQQSDEELAFLMAHDSDSFARWEAAQALTVNVTKQMVDAYRAGHRLQTPDHWVAAFAPLLRNDELDPKFVSFMLALPAEQYLAQFFSIFDVDAIHAVRQHLLRSISSAYHADLHAIYKRIAAEGSDGMGSRASALRSLRSRTLEYIALSDDDRDLELAVEQRRKAKNMTDELGALQALNETSKAARQIAMDEFYAKWKNEPLVMNKWLTIQALAPSKDALERVQKLAKDPIFDANNPNKIYSLFVAFSRFNLVRFHDKTGKAYRYVADQIMDIDSRNPQVASRLMSAFNQMKTFDEERQALMRVEINRILAKPELSTNVFEIASKTLNS